LPPTWTKEELGKRRSIEHFFGRVFLFFHLQRPPLCGWSEIACQVALPLRRFCHCWPGCSSLLVVLISSVRLSVF
jgi:hypothetical protein